MKIFLYLGRELHCLSFCLGKAIPFGKLINRNPPIFLSPRSVDCNKELRTVKHK
jgi:hypothetical protein